MFLLYTTFPIFRSLARIVPLQALVPAWVLASVLSFLLAPGATNASEAPYPERPVSLVVGYGPGGMGDRLARVASEHLPKLMKGSFIVENRPGANATIAGKHVLASKRDGHTLLVGQPGEIVVNRLLMKDVGYDAVKELEPVVLMGNAPLVVVARADAPFNTMREFVDLVRRTPEKYSYASLGVGTPGHMAAVAIELGFGLKLIHVPYKGINQLMPDLLGGHVNLFIVTTSTALPLVKSGKLKVLAVTTPRRVAALPNVETVAESGLPEFSYTVWGGLFAPRGTPRPVIERLNRDINQMLAQPDIRAQFEADGIAVPSNTPVEFADYVAREAAKYESLVQRAQIKPE